MRVPGRHGRPMSGGPEEVFTPGTLGVDRLRLTLLWVLAAFLPTVLRFALFGSVGSYGFDWSIYRHGLELWVSTGSPYQVPPPGWDPLVWSPYMYTPASWSLLIATVLPAPLTLLALVPIAMTPPLFWLIPLGALFMLVGLGPAALSANVSLLVAGLLVLSFRPGRLGGLAFACALAIRPYPLVLLPFLWGDRERLRWFLGVTAALAASGTLLFGLDGWRDFVLTFLHESDNAPSLSPFALLGSWRVVPALGVAALGLRLRSPTITLAGATWLGGYVSPHYYVTLAATLPFERVCGLQRTPSKPNVPSRGFADRVAQCWRGSDETPSSGRID